MSRTTDMINAAATYLMLGSLGLFLVSGLVVSLAVLIAG